jgi:hypothetical protein
MPIMPAEAGLQPGALLASRYLIVRTIHRGGMSRLYLAKDAAHGGHEVALKELRLAPDTLLPVPARRLPVQPCVGAAARA